MVVDVFALLSVYMMSGFLSVRREAREFVTPLAGDATSQTFTHSLIVRR